jgi:hypothetical protein
MKVETRYQAPRWWGNGEWLTISNTPRDNGHAIGSMHGLRFVNITARAENGGLLSGLTHGVTDVTFDNVHVKIGAWANYSKGPLPCFENPVICTNESQPLCVNRTGQPIPGSPISCLGSRDYRPTPDTTSNCSYYCRSSSKADGLFMENAHNVSFKGFTVEFEGARLPHYGGCLVVDRLSTGIHGADSVKCINGPPAPLPLATGH